MIVVSDSSPLVSLAAIGRLELLHELYDTIIIPRAVHHEVVR
jgi:predicted nucleic acid-binding protein